MIRDEETLEECTAPCPAKERWADNNVICRATWRESSRAKSQSMHLEDISIEILIWQMFGWLVTATLPSEENAGGGREKLKCSN